MQAFIMCGTKGVMLKAGELYRFPEGFGHCRHGLLRVEETRDGLRLRDTYWGGFGNDDRLWRPAELDGRIEFVLDLSASRQVDREQFERYRETDRAWIPVGGGSEQFWVRCDASPDPALVEEQIRNQIAEAERDIQGAMWRLRHLSIRLGEHLESVKGAKAAA